jgi:hypothetical protein
MALDAQLDRAFGRDLDRQVQRGLDDEVLGRFADQRADLGVDIVGEVLGALVGQGGRDLHRRAERLVALSSGVMALMRTISSRTMVARRAARSLAETGE